MSEEFWEVANPLVAADVIEEGTMMGSACVRRAGEFVAMPNFKGDGIVIKLPRVRVSELIAAETGQPFAPAGKVFSEWVLIPSYDETLWQALLRESAAFVTS